MSGERLRDSPWRDRIVDHPLLAPLRRQLVPRWVRNRIKRAWQMREKPVIGDATLTRATALFDEDLGRLGGMLGIELNCRNFKAVVRDRPLDWA